MSDTSCEVMREAEKNQEREGGMSVTKHTHVRDLRNGLCPVHSEATSRVSGVGIGNEVSASNI